MLGPDLRKVRDHYLARLRCVPVERGSGTRTDGRALRDSPGIEWLNERGARDEA